MATKDERRQIAEKNLAALHENIAAAVETMQTPEGWKAWLDITSSFPQYSLNNQLALFKQSVGRGINPRAFASFRRWKEAGYPVQKGQQSFRVLGPVLKKRPHDKESGKPLTDGEADNRDSSTIVWKRVPVAFKAVPVFEISQTEAAELTQIPEELVPEKLTGLAPDGLIDRLTHYAASHGTPVEYQPLAQLGGANGYFRADRDGSNRRIVVGADLDEAARAKTLIHEIAHMRLHVDSQGMSRSTQEIEAESTAYVVAAQFGLDTSQYTFRYVGGWSGYDADAIRETAQRVIDISGEITDAVRVTEEIRTDDAAEERALDLTSRTAAIAEQATETADSLEAAWAGISLADSAEYPAAAVRQSAYSAAAHHGLGVGSKVLHDGTLSFTRDDAANLTVVINDDAGGVRLSWTSYDWEPHGMEYQGEWEQSLSSIDALDSIRSTVRSWAAESNPIETRGLEDIDELAAATSNTPATATEDPVFTTEDVADDETLDDEGAIHRGSFILRRTAHPSGRIEVTDSSGNVHNTAMIADLTTIRQLVDVWQIDRNLIDQDHPLLSAPDLQLERMTFSKDYSEQAQIARRIYDNRTNRPGVIHSAGTSKPAVPGPADVGLAPAELAEHARDYLQVMDRIELAQVEGARLDVIRPDAERITVTTTPDEWMMRVDWQRATWDGSRYETVDRSHEYVDRETAHEHVVDQIVQWKDESVITEGDVDEHTIARCVAFARGEAPMSSDNTHVAKPTAPESPPSFSEAMSTMYSAMSDGQFAINFDDEPSADHDQSERRPELEL